MRVIVQADEAVRDLYTDITRSALVEYGGRCEEYSKGHAKHSHDWTRWHSRSALAFLLADLVLAEALPKRPDQTESGT